MGNKTKDNFKRKVEVIHGRRQTSSGPTWEQGYFMLTLECGHYAERPYKIRVLQSTATTAPEKTVCILCRVLAK